MGVVFEVVEVQTQRRLALKLVEGRLDDRRAERFRREGEITASLDHPGIVRVISAGSLGERPYLAYELVEGARSLDDVFHKASLDERVALLRDAARALGHAHRAGVIHRDVKPDNVLVDAKGQVRVTDFGLAAAQGLERLTRTGAALGTPTHMSPEQITGQSRDTYGPPTDVWSLGVILYDAMTGELPFQGATMVELGAQISAIPPHRPSTISRELTPGLEAICLQALEKDPAKRYPDAGEFADDLDRYLAGEDPLALGRRRRGSRRGLAVGLLVVLGVVGAAVGSSPAEPTPEPAAQPASPVASPSAAADDPPAEVVEVEAPAWFTALASEARPPLPLPAGLSFTETPGDYRNDADGSRMRYIPAGTFVMGPPDYAREVTLTRGYFLGKFEVTWGQFMQFGAATDQDMSRWELIPQNPERAAGGLSYEEAAAYATWAGCRLPSDAQWEYGARGADGRPFPWGDAFDETYCNNRQNGYPGVAPPGSFPEDRSPFGCYDMAGNVLEWTRTRYTAEPDVSEVVDPVGPEVGAHRTLRGGHYDQVLRGAATYSREGRGPDQRSLHTGVRLYRPERDP